MKKTKKYLIFFFSIYKNSKHYRNHKQKHWKEACEGYQNLYEEEKQKIWKKEKPEKDIKILQKKKKKKGLSIISKIHRSYLSIEETII